MNPEFISISPFETEDEKEERDIGVEAGLTLGMFNSCLWIISTINADVIHNQVGLFMFEWKAHTFAHTKLHCEQQQQQKISFYCLNNYALIKVSKRGFWELWA